MPTEKTRIEVKYVDNQVEPRNRDNSYYIDKAMKDEKGSSKITLHHPTRGTTNFFLIKIGGKFLPHSRLIEPEMTYFFTTHKRKNKWIQSAPKELPYSWSKQLQNQISTKLQKGYKLTTEEQDRNYDSFTVIVRLMLGGTVIKVTTEERSPEMDEQQQEEPLTLIDLLLM